MSTIVELYNNGKNIKSIAQILNLDESYVQEQIIQHKLKKVEYITEESILISALSMNKGDRIDFLFTLDKSSIQILQNEIQDYIKTTRPYEDIVTILWIIGELHLSELSEILCLHSSSKNGNIKRITYSSMGKLRLPQFVPYLKMGCSDEKSQVRMYAIKSLSKYDHEPHKLFFQKILLTESDGRNREILLKIINEVSSEKF